MLKIATAIWQIVEKASTAKYGLKQIHGLTHGNANSLVHYCNQSHSEDTEDKSALINEQYKGKEALRPWFEKLINYILGFGDDIVFSAKKGYMSVRRKKQFSILQPSTKTRLDIGLNLKNTLPTGRLQAGKAWNAMCTHRIKIEKETDLDQTVFDVLQKAYDEAG